MPVLQGHYSVEEIAIRWNVKTKVVQVAKARIGITGTRHGRYVLITPTELPLLETELKRLGYSMDED